MSDEMRMPPAKIRVTKLQEAQLFDLAATEASCAQMLYEEGVSPNDLQPRDDNGIARLTRSHDVLVAEADHVVAGHLVWADQAPGVAWLPALLVAPAFQRFGVATVMLRELGELALRHGIDVVVAAAWPAAASSAAFLRARGFAPFDGDVPKKLVSWRELNPDVAAPGQALWWAKTDGLGTIPGLPRPSQPPPSA